jgi:hypothetical protein
VQDELINELLPFALHFTSRSRVLSSSLDELVARKMTQNWFGGVMKELDDILLTRTAVTHDLTPRYFTSR